MKPKMIPIPPKLSQRVKMVDNALNLDDDGLVGPSSFITPEGYGFTASADRILRERGGKGFYRAKSTESVIDVMRAITTEPAEHDVALIFDEENPEKVIGLFTESDYIRVGTSPVYVQLLRSVRKWASHMNGWVKGKLICLH